VQTSETAQLFGLLGFVTGGPDTLIGRKCFFSKRQLTWLLTDGSLVNCTPLSIVGSGDNSCTAQPVCCTGNDFVRFFDQLSPPLLEYPILIHFCSQNGLVVLGCNPLNVGSLANVIAVAELVADLVDGA